MPNNDQDPHHPPPSRGASSVCPNQLWPGFRIFLPAITSTALEMHFDFPTSACLTSSCRQRGWAWAGYSFLVLIFATEIAWYNPTEEGSSHPTTTTTTATLGIESASFPKWHTWDHHRGCRRRLSQWLLHQVPAAVVVVVCFIRFVCRKKIQHNKSARNVREGIRTGLGVVLNPAMMGQQHFYPILLCRRYKGRYLGPLRLARDDALLLMW